VTQYRTFQAGRKCSPTDYVTERNPSQNSRHHLRGILKDLYEPEDHLWGSKWCSSSCTRGVWTSGYRLGRGPHLHHGPTAIWLYGTETAPTRGFHETTCCPSATRWCRVRQWRVVKGRLWSGSCSYHSTMNPLRHMGLIPTYSLLLLVSFLYHLVRLNATGTEGLSRVTIFGNFGPRFFGALWISSTHRDAIAPSEEHIQ
jgi:hypothetical protein